MTCKPFSANGVCGFICSRGVFGRKRSPIFRAKYLDEDLNIVAEITVHAEDQDGALTDALRSAPRKAYYVQVGNKKVSLK